MQSQNQSSNQQQARTVAQAIIEQLVEYGVQRIYGVIGDAIFPFLDAISKQKSIQFISTKHEFTAACMASAEAKLTGKMGVCMATSGPGIANLLNGLGDAQVDQVPVLAITGQVETTKLGTDTKQYIDQQKLTSAVSGYSTLLVHADATMDILQKAFQIAQNNGCVSHVSIPKDVFEQTTSQSIRKTPTLIQGAAEIRSEQLQPVQSVLAAAQRPMVVAGWGARGYGEIVEEFADVLGAGIICSLGAKGVIDDACPWMVGGIGEGGSPYASDLLKQADVVVLIGDTWWPEDFVPKQTTIIQIDMDSAHIGIGFDVQYGLIGDGKQIVPLLTKGLQKAARQMDSWREQIRTARGQWQDTIEKEHATDTTPMHPGAVMGMLEKVAPADAIIAIDTGDHTLWLNRDFRAKRQRVLFSGMWRTLGYGLPAALAAKAASPNHAVFAVVGDGGLAMCLADLVTAVRYELPITLLLMNNGSLAMEKNKMQLEGVSQIGSKHTNPDFQELAKSCGWESVHVDTIQELEQHLRNASNSKTPYFIDARISDEMVPAVSKHLQSMKA